MSLIVISLRGNYAQEEGRMHGSTESKYSGPEGRGDPQTWAGASGCGRFCKLDMKIYIQLSFYSLRRYKWLGVL
jgi:hypothetical protein